jgi:O-antigen biosynthesis protein WbqP
MLRLLDITLAALGLLLSAPLLALIALLCFMDTRSPFFLQERVGRGGRPFVLVKFRTMRVGTASVATHLADASAATRLGTILRRTKLDELPQLWNVLLGHMSIVGPRPCLLGQHELIRERMARHVFDVRPGITGLAQIRGIDMSTPRLLAETDAEMIVSHGIGSYLRLMLLTVLGSGRGDRLRH